MLQNMVRNDCSKIAASGIYKNLFFCRKQEKIADVLMDCPFFTQVKSCHCKKERKVTHCYELVKLPVSHIVYILSQMYSCKFGKNVQNFADSCVNHC